MKTTQPTLQEFVDYHRLTPYTLKLSHWGNHPAQAYRKALRTRLGFAAIWGGVVIGGAATLLLFGACVIGLIWIVIALGRAIGGG